MKTKIFTIFVMSIFLFSLMSVGVLAQDSDSSKAQVSEDAALAVSSDDVVSLASDDEDISDSSGIGRDKIKSWFTFNKEKKAKIKMRIAKKRMFEVGEKAKKHPEKAKEIAKEYENELNDALNHYDEIAVDGDKEEVIKALKRTVIIKFKLENHKEKSSELHEKILEKKKDQMTEDQLAKLEDVFSTIEQHIEDSLAHVEQTQENLKARLIALGVDESKIEDRTNEFESRLDAKKQKREDHLKEFKEKMEEHRAEIEDRLEAEDDAASDSEDSSSSDSEDDSSLDVASDSESDSSTSEANSDSEDSEDSDVADTQVLN